MAKISPVAAKYIVHATIEIDGVVDRPDIIGAVFGQTEGLLGSDLELRELQRSGRIGRIEVATDTKSGKTKGTIDIPSSLDKAETAIVAAALEIIQRIGPCNAKIVTQNIEDVRVSKRQSVVDRAKQLLTQLMNKSMPDSQELADEVAYSVRVMEIEEYGKDRLPAGPQIDESDEIIVVEGRADVLNLLKHGFKNAVAMNGTNVPEGIIELCKKKVVTLFVDGDRGGNLIFKELSQLADVDFFTRAPDGKEVEEITKKEIHKAIRSRVSGEQAKHDIEKQGVPQAQRRPMGAGNNQNRGNQDRRPQQGNRQNFEQRRGPQVSADQKKAFKESLESMVGTRGAQVMDSKMKTLGKVPLSELAATVKGLGNTAFAIVLDGPVDRDLAKASDSVGVKFLVAMESKVKPQEVRATVLTLNEL